MEPTLKSVDGDGMEEEGDLEKKRNEMREKVHGEPLSLAEKAHLIQKCQKISTKRQINLGKIVHLLWFSNSMAQVQTFN